MARRTKSHLKIWNMRDNRKSHSVLWFWYLEREGEKKIGHYRDFNQDFLHTRSPLGYEGVWKREVTVSNKKWKNSTYLLRVRHFIHLPPSCRILSPFHLHRFDPRYISLPVVQELLTQNTELPGIVVVLHFNLFVSIVHFQNTRELGPWVILASFRIRLG